MFPSKFAFGAVVGASLLAPSGDALACGGGPTGMGMAMMAPAAAVAVAAPGFAATVALPGIGATVSVLPQGYLTVVVKGASFFRAGPTWYQPIPGPTGPMYRVVPAPYGM